MKRKRHGPEQIIAKLRDADAMLATGATIGQVCQRIEVSEQTFHRWPRTGAATTTSAARIPPCVT